jgi:hypothetical protein
MGCNIKRNNTSLLELSLFVLVIKYFGPSPPCGLPVYVLIGNLDIADLAIDVTEKTSQDPARQLRGIPLSINVELHPDIFNLSSKYSYRLLM